MSFQFQIGDRVLKEGRHQPGTVEGVDTRDNEGVRYLVVWDSETHMPKVSWYTPGELRLVGPLEQLAREGQ